MLQEGSYDAAVQGCDAVIHTASPYMLSVPPGKEKEMLIDPALKGTESVLGMPPHTTTLLAFSMAVLALCEQGGHFQTLESLDHCLQR